jgi:cytochrome c556
MWLKANKNTLTERRTGMKLSLSYLVLALGAAGLLYSTGSIAHGDHDHPKGLPKAKDSINFRHYLMENIGENAKAMKAKLDGGRVAEMAVNAQAIALHSTRIAELFPQGSTSDSSRAKAEIWQQWEDFVKSATMLSTEADQLAQTAVNGEAETAGAQLRKVFGACKSCHDQFRKPEKKA